MSKRIVGATPEIASHDAVATRNLRHVFWQNVVQQMLTAFPLRAGKNPDLADGRVAVLTRAGERIPIKRVQPLFACSVPSAPSDRALSLAVQCTVFEIHTPDGEIFTLPLEQIRGVHVLTEDLLKQLQAINDTPDGADEPFGYAAFTSLARQQSDAEAEKKP